MPKWGHEIRWLTLVKISHPDWLHVLAGSMPQHLFHWCWIDRARHKILL